MSSVIRWVVPLVLCLAVGWVVLLAAAPLLPPVPAAITYLLGSLVCHQRPERSFHLAAAQLPVCARCLGIYAGMACGIGLGRLVRRLSGRGKSAAARGSDPARMPTRNVRLILAAGALPTLLTVAAEWTGVWQSSNAVRAAAGALLGMSVAVVVNAALATLHYGGCAPRLPVTTDRPPSPI